MKKVVLKLELHDDKAKQKAMKKVSSLSGLDSIAIDSKDNKLTVTGDIDPVKVVAKLRKLCHTEIVSVGPAKESEKKKDEPKKEDPKKADDKKKDGKEKDAGSQPAKANPAYIYHYHPPPYFYQQHPYYYGRSVEEDPNACVIC